MGDYEDHIRTEFIDKFVKRNKLKQMTTHECIRSMYDLSDEMKEEEEEDKKW